MSYLIETLPNYSIYLTWDRKASTTNLRYDILYSPNFDGDYTLLDSVDWPGNEYIHTEGSPTFYYKIREVDITDPLNEAILSTGQPVIGDEALVLASLMYQIKDLLSVPVHDEEVIFARDRKSGTLAFDNWNNYPVPEIRISSGSEDNSTDSFAILSTTTPVYNTLSTTMHAFTVDAGVYDGIETSSPHGFANNDQVKFVGTNLPTEITAGDTYTVVYNGTDVSRFTLSGITFTGTGDGQTYLASGELSYTDGLKYKINYQGKIYFIDENDSPIAVQPYDMVYASYGVKLFTEHEINDAAELALQAINMQPGTTKASSVAGAPLYYDPCIVAGACYYLIRGLLLRLTQRETRLLVDDPDKTDMLDNLKELAKMYKEDFDGYLKVVGIARYPRSSSIVTPEYMMPGGRSRFFRYIWKGGT